MIDINEISTWSAEEALAEVYAALPPGWRFMWQEEPKGYFESKFVDEEGALQWRSPLVVDFKVAVLDAYGWLYARQNRPRNPRWALKPDITPQAVNARLGLIPPKRTEGVPDPGDLDPSEIQRILKQQTTR